MNKYLACITCGSNVNYLIAKIFEIPASGSLLLLNEEMTHIVQKVGYEPYVHYIPYTFETFESVISFVLDTRNKSTIDKIRTNAQNLVLHRHSSSHRSS